MCVRVFLTYTCDVWVCINVCVCVRLCKCAYVCIRARLQKWKEKIVGVRESASEEMCAYIVRGG